MKKGFACGVFDLYHPGHARMLEECRNQCDYLVVALNSARHLKDAPISAHKNEPVFSIEERVEVIGSIRWVDEVLIYNSEEELLAMMKDLKPDIRFLGDDYNGRLITGAELNIPIYYIGRGHGYSTSGLIKRILARYTGNQKGTAP